MLAVVLVYSQNILAMSCSEGIKKSIIIDHRLIVRDEFADLGEVYKSHIKKVLSPEEILRSAKRIEEQQPIEYSQNHFRLTSRFHQRGDNQEAYELFYELQSSKVQSILDSLQSTDYPKFQKFIDALFQGIGRRQNFWIASESTTKDFVVESKEIFIGLPPQNSDLLDVLMNNGYMLTAPATEYGHAAQNKVATAVRIMLERSTDPEFTAVVKAGTMQNRFGESLKFWRKFSDPPEWNDNFPASQRALNEGIMTIFQAISYLSTHKVPGIESMDELVRLLTQDPSGNSLIWKFAMTTPTGYLGPMSQNGYKSALAPLKLVEGKMDFSDHLNALNKSVKNLLSEPDKNGIFTGKGCPFGIRFKDKQSPLQDLLDEFFRIYETL
jgi:hypothetical protein